MLREREGRPAREKEYGRSICRLSRTKREMGGGKKRWGDERVRGRALDLETYERVADSGTGDRITGSIESDPRD